MREPALSRALAIKSGMILGFGTALAIITASDERDLTKVSVKDSTA
jgi:hypothetical protein